MCDQVLTPGRASVHRAAGRRGRPLGAHGAWGLRPAPESGLQTRPRLSPQQRAWSARGRRALFSDAFPAGGRACPGVWLGSQTLASQGHCPSQGRASSSGDTGEESLPLTGWSKVGGEPVGRRGRRWSLRHTASDRRGPEASPEQRRPCTPLSELTHPRATNPAQVKCISWMVKSSPAPPPLPSSLSARRWGGRDKGRERAAPAPYCMPAARVPAGCGGARGQYRDRSS